MAVFLYGVIKKDNSRWLTLYIIYILIFFLKHSYIRIDHIIFDNRSYHF